MTRKPTDRREAVEIMGEAVKIERYGSMKLENLAARRAETEDAIAEVKAWIRPLPEDVEPSQEFLRRTRLQLLKLPREAGSRQQQAA